MITVHLVLNAHIDPVWLWPWQAGADEMLATCRSACDRLDNHPDIVFTHGDAWGFRIIEQIDPALFARIRAHVEAGRWEIAGGWWIQPDCNLPGGVGFEKQIELGRKYFESRFGIFPKIAYNIDSFGHAASLPGLMRRSGQDRYVMMRPQEHELALPARLFLWRGFADDDGVVTFRIARNYETRRLTREHVLASLEGLPPGVSHTMCFVGVGDHGGGPTERQIAWCRENASAIPGARLAFSSPQRFFDAVAREGAALPSYTGELQYHAVGCYSVTRSIKTAVRRAEHALEQASVVARSCPPGEDDTQARLERAWENVCFNHFHDTLGGTCIPSAYPPLEDQLRSACAMADEIAQLGFRRAVANLPDDARQRLALFNASDRAYDGYAIFAPWTGARWKPHWRVHDGDGGAIPYQLVREESVADPRPRLLLRAHLAPAQMKTLVIDRDAAATEEPALAVTAAAEGERLRSGAIAIDLAREPELHLAPAKILSPRLELYDDPTDTWSHGVERIGQDLIGIARWQPPILVDHGPLMASAVQRGAVGEALLAAEWRVYAGEPFAELLLRVDWRAKHQVLKLAVSAPGIVARTDGIPASALRRTRFGREMPMRDFSILHVGEGPDIGIVAPNVFGTEMQDGAVFFTLLRSPLMAHHDPAPADGVPCATFSDQGTHNFRFRFVCGAQANVAWLEDQAAMAQRPLLTADWTKGMAASSSL